MITDALLESEARRLGVWATSESKEWPEPYAVTCVDGSYAITISAPHVAPYDVHVDRPTLALWMLGLGRRVDVGECTACRERGSAVIEHQFTSGLPSWDSAALLRRGWTLAKSTWFSSVWHEPCASCTVDGRPTGRRTVPWEDAMIDATPRNCELCPDGSGTACRRICVTRWKADDHVRTCLAVMADAMQASTVDGREGGREGDRERALGLWLAAWLAGPCRACGGNGKHHPMPLDGLQASYSYDPDRPCSRCHGHGTILGEHEAAIAAALGGVCSACGGDGSCGWCGGSPARDGSAGITGHPDCYRCEGSGQCKTCDGNGYPKETRP